MRHRIRFMKRVLVGLSLCLVMAGTASAQYYTSFGKNKIRYGKFDWKSYDSPHFTFYYYPSEEESLERVVSMAESAYDRLSRELDFQIQEKTPFIFYETHSDFLQTNIIAGFIPEGVAAFATPARFRMVMPIDLSDDELYELISHELTHIFQYHILFGGGLGRSLALNPPLWLMEGMASYFAEDESTSDRMFLRDAVVNDSIPPITQSNIQGFFAYRFGHAAFDFMEERWGRDGVMDFLFEFRNTIGSRVGRAVERAFGLEAEDFDIEFRRWLRAKYLPELVASGEPSDFGKPFRTDVRTSQETSPAASPSGDLVAAFSTYKQDLDVVLFDAENRDLVRNLTKGYTTKFQNFVGQHLTKSRLSGSDIAFSGDGNQLAVFVRRGAGYSLALVNVLKKGIDRIIDMDVEQQVAPTWHPFENKIAFAGNDAGEFDIFLLDLDTLEIINLTTDDLYDSGPSFSKDGKSIVFSTVTGEGGADLFRIDLDNPDQRIRITSDGFHNVDPVFSSDGKSVYYTSDRTGAENIYAIELESGKISQYTNAVTGCFQPTLLIEPSGRERLVYTGYWKGRFDLYERDLEEPIATFEAEAAKEVTEIERFEPDIQVAIDETAKGEKRSRKLFLEDAQSYVGIDTDQTFLGQVILTFSDFFGDKRLVALVGSVDTFQNFDVWYSDLSRRNNWTVHLFDDRTFFIGIDQRTGFLERGQRAYKVQGATFTLEHPISLYRRFTLGIGYQRRDIDYQFFAIDESGFDYVRDDMGNPIPVIQPREDDYPILQAGFVSDTAVFGPAGPSSGHRLKIGLSYAPDFDKSNTVRGDSPGNTLTSTLELDYRKYFPLTRRSVFAVRGYGKFSDGNFPDYAIFGGLDTVRGYELYSLVGDQGFYANFELRFPLIDFFVTPVLSFQGIQGRFFFDIAGAWFSDVQNFSFLDDDNNLEDAVASYGMGFTVNFLGVDLNWDFARRYDLDTSGPTETTFWVGRRF